MKSPDVPAGRKPAGHAATPRASNRASRLQVLSLRNWPVSRRLFAVIVMAVVMGLVFGGLRVAAAANTAAGFARTSQLAVLGEQVTALAQAMENERDLTGAYIASTGADNAQHVAGGPPLPVKTQQSYESAMMQAQAATNSVAARVQALAGQIGGSFPAITQSKAQNVIAVIGNLSGLRSQSQSEPALSVVEGYTEGIADLFDLNDEITSGSGDPVLADEVRTLDAISRAKDQASQQRAILYASLVDGVFPGGAQQALLTSGQLENSDLLLFESSATNAELAAYQSTVAGLPVNTAQLLNNYLLTSGSAPQSLISPTKVGKAVVPGGTMALTKYMCDLTTATEQFCSAVPQVWYSNMSVTIGKMRSVEQQLASQIVARSQALQQGARQSAQFTAAVTGGVLLLVLIATIIVARSLVEPLRRLQADALEVATVRLPERVAELSEATDPQAALKIEPISVNSTDEIGKVARAFDQVHREAVRLAGNEALLRGNLNTMFISLSRRSVPLIERLARMIDSLEQNEDDPDRLSNLFSMDHLVTRMRRNSENLLVLAGEEPVRKWSEPVPLADVARAAASEIEQYSRVVLNIQPGIAVSGQAAADVVHLLAEIIENATMFSPRDTPVQVSGQELSSGGVLLEVRDSGVGVSPPRLAEMNWRLDNPPLIDVSVSRHMGLFAVSRLAARHGVRVRLRPVSPQGLSALIWLPGNLTGREAVRYTEPTYLAGQPAAALRMGGRRISGRHRYGLRSADENGYASLGSGSPGAPGSPVAPAATVSNWFRPKRPSIAGAQETVIGTVSTVPQQPAARGYGTDTWSNGGWRSAETAAAPLHGDHTAAGLPTRIPKANLFPGSMGGRPGSGPSTGPIPVFGQPAASYQPPPGGYVSPPVSYEPEPPMFPQSTAPRRSAEMARARLSGFQLGSRDAQGRTPHPGED
jgi:signal transduction histidine kinase